MSIFDDMNDDFFANGDLIETALYFEGGSGVGQKVPIYLNEKDMVSDVLNYSAISTGRELEVRVSDIAIIREGDAFEFKGKLYSVKSSPMKDADGRNWLVELGG